MSTSLRGLGFVALTLLALAGCQSSDPAAFDSPEQALQALVSACDDAQMADELLGPGGFELLRSGDDVADRQDLEAVRVLMGQRVDFQDVADGCKIAILGNEGWELPLPLILEDGRWRFDVEAGREEVLNRRVGRNELSTIASLRAIVEAQGEYAAEGRDARAPTFAARIVSSEGQHDGLYWPAMEGEAESPLGPLVAQAALEGYQRGDGAQRPYRGYYYRLLTEQGASAPGDAHSYLDEQGQLTRGFAVVAWPANYHQSGVMTFLVNHRGILFQKDLGEETGEVVDQILAYDPDLSWDPVSD